MRLFNRNYIEELLEYDVVVEHYGLHNVCNLKISSVLPRMIYEQFHYLKKINLTNYLKILNKQLLYCEICQHDIRIKNILPHTQSSWHKYNKLFVQIVQNISKNKETDFIVLNINWLQCRYCGTMIMNKYPYKLIDTHLQSTVHKLHKAYCSNLFILKQYGHTLHQFDVLKPIDVLLSNQCYQKTTPTDKTDVESKMKIGKSRVSEEKRRAQRKLQNRLQAEQMCRKMQGTFLPTTLNTTYIVSEGVQQEKSLEYMTRLLFKFSSSCRICYEIQKDHKKKKNEERRNKKRANQFDDLIYEPDILKLEKYTEKYPKSRRERNEKVKSTTLEKIRAKRDNYVCQTCSKSVPNCKDDIHHHMKGKKHNSKNMLPPIQDMFWQIGKPRKYSWKQNIVRLLDEDFRIQKF